MKSSIVTIPICKMQDGASTTSQDFVAVEEPLQIRLNERDVAITMRTPGNDDEIAAGFLFGEGILGNRDQISDISNDGRGAITIRLAAQVEIENEFAARNFYMTSSCGICGKASIDGLKSAGCRSLDSQTEALTRFAIESMPEKLRAGQAVFEHTGGLHAAGLFDFHGNLLAVREDVGRHNAVDKLVGAAFLAGQLPLTDRILMLSGRVSFELVQKALMAGIAVIAAVGAPSSLAVETALRFGITLIGFLRGNRFNVYSGRSKFSFSA